MEVAWIDVAELNKVGKLLDLHCLKQNACTNDLYTAQGELEVLKLNKSMLF